MQISGIAIQLNPENSETVQQQLQSINDLEIHAQEGSKIVATLENRTPGEMSNTLEQIQDIDGVLLVNPVYIYDDAAVDPAEMITTT